jgi:hypothetical protein
MSIEIYGKMGSFLNDILKSKNYQVAPTYPKGKPGSNDKRYREYRLQLINKQNDTSASVIPHIERELRKDSNFTSIKFNQISPNSSKFPSYSFVFDGLEFDIIIARGANRGENFETATVNNLGAYFKTRQNSELGQVIEQMNESYKPFADVEIVNVKQRTGATKKEGIPIAQLGAIIGDIVLTDNKGKDWFISLKDVNGNTFSSYSGAASLFDRTGTLQPNSAGAEFLRSFGVDLNKVQEGFDARAGINKPRPRIKVEGPNQQKLEKIFNRAWGMNYFYVRRMPGKWKVFWLDKAKLDKLSRNIVINEIRYPNNVGRGSKQITIKCSNAYESYIVELRNSSAGEYPNDIKFKVTK